MNLVHKEQPWGDAIWRRLYVIDFPVTFSAAEQDQDLNEKLRAELPGILNWALQGLSEWEREGLPPESVVRATSAYRGESDTVR